uniref:Uncharacterized protein n=1 Tax=Arundo donax TaxID=35708 RepID=A0A0A9G4V0_ARUDO
MVTCFSIFLESFSPTLFSQNHCKHTNIVFLIQVPR